MQLWNIEEAHPGLKGSGYEITSEVSDVYNCIAWSAGEDTIWWSHTPGNYWPPGIPRSPEVGALIQVFESLGFAICEDEQIETGYEKVAVFALSGEWSHAARQMEDGQWTSKVGQFEDITHPLLQNLADDAYGDVHCIMRRPTASTP